MLFNVYIWLKFDDPLGSSNGAPASPQSSLACFTDYDRETKEAVEGILAEHKGTPTKAADYSEPKERHSTTTRRHSRTSAQFRTPLKLYSAPTRRHEGRLAAKTPRQRLTVGIQIVKTVWLVSRTKALDR